MGAEHWIGRLQGLLAVGVRLGGEALMAAERAPGFAFDETMTGTVSLHAPGFPDGERRMQVQLHVEADSLGAYLRGGRADLRGHAEIDSVTRDARCAAACGSGLTGASFATNLPASSTALPCTSRGRRMFACSTSRHTMSSTLPAKFRCRGRASGRRQLGLRLG